MYNGRKVYAIVLAAGNGRRMHSKTKKQFMEILGRPLFSWSASCFDRHDAVDGIILTTGEEDIPYMKELTQADGAYPLEKLSAIVAGGKERYHSVFEGLKKVAELEKTYTASSGTGMTPSGTQDPLIMIHDCARPMLTDAIIDDALHYAEKYHAAVIGMPVKDTIKVLDADHFVKETPERSSLWLMQTPQSFDFSLIYKAYAAMIDQEARGHLMIPITDDAVVVESFAGQRVKIISGSYENIKVTTPEDVKMAEYYLSTAFKKNSENS